MRKQMDGGTTKNLVFKIISLGVTFIVTILITRIIVNTIGSEVNGYYSLANDFVNYAMILSIALNSMGNRFITIAFYKDDVNDVNSYFNSIFFANIFLGITVAVPMMGVVWKLDALINISSELIVDVKILFALMFANFIIIIVSSVFSVATFIKNRVDLDSLRIIESYGLRIVLLLLFFKIFTPRIYFLGIAVLISNIYIFCVNICYVKKLTPEIRIFDLKYFTIQKLKEVISSGIWNSFTRIGAVLLNGLDLLIANLYVSSTAMGVLSVSKTFPKLILSSMSGFASAFTPKITIEYAKNNLDGCLKAIEKSVNLCAVVSIAIQSVLIVAGKDIYVIWVPAQDSNRLYVLSTIATLGFLIIMPFECLYTVFTVTNKIKVSSIYLFLEAVATIVIVLISMNVVKDEFTKLCVIAGVSSIAEIIRGVLFLPLYSAYCLNIKKTYFYQPMIKIFVANVFVILAGMLVCNFISIDRLIGLVIKCLVIGCLSLTTWYFIVLSETEKIEYVSIFRRYLK